MVHASLQQSKKNGERAFTQEALRLKVHSSAKTKESDNKKLREISAGNLTCTVVAIGNGTFGTCYPGKHQEFML